MPIEFYGKVVDQDGRPVAGAKMEIIATDASPTGNFKRTLVSNNDGKVILSGVSGKGFDVLLSKEGYDEYRGNRKTFEYAAFWDPFFYQPDQADPVVFKLRKKSIAEPIVYKQTELHFGNRTVDESNLYKDTGLRVVLLENRSPREHKWSIRIEILNGAIRPTIDEFPVEAPADGYQSTVVVDTASPKPPDWQSLYEGASFYLKTSSNYGRLNVKMIPGKPWLRIESWINPRDGSRNLEYDPSQTVSSANR